MVTLILLLKFIEIQTFMQKANLVYASLYVIIMSCTSGCQEKCCRTKLATIIGGRLCNRKFESLFTSLPKVELLSTVCHEFYNLSHNVFVAQLETVPILDSAFVQLVLPQFSVRLIQGEMIILVN